MTAALEGKARRTAKQDGFRRLPDALLDGYQSGFALQLEGTSKHLSVATRDGVGLFGEVHRLAVQALHHLVTTIACGALNSTTATMAREASG